MKKIILFICMIMMFTLPCVSQEIGEETPEKVEPVIPSDPNKPSAPSDPVNPSAPKGPSEPDGTVLFQPVRKGDKFMKIGASLGVPLFNTSRKKFAINPKIYPGGTIDLGFGYYVLNGFSLGGSLSFQFYPTVSKNIYFAVPISFDMAYTFALKKWRIPLGAGIGGAFQSYNGAGSKYFGLMAKANAGVYYQYNPNFSIGGNLDWMILPQWYKDTTKNRIGNFFHVAFSVRYHF